MKRIIAITLLIALLFSLALPVHATEPVSIQPRYTDAGDVEILLGISSSGKVTVRAICMGDSEVQSVNLKIYLQRKVGSSWVTVTGCTWSANNLSSCFSKTYTTNISTSGEYRALAYFYLTSTSTSTISATSYASY